MLLGDMNISRLMTHSHQVKGDKLREQAKENKKARTGNYDYSQNKSGGGNCSQSQQKFSAPARSSTSVPSSKNKYDLSHMGVFQEQRIIPLVPSVVRTIRASASQERRMIWVRSVW